MNTLLHNENVENLTNKLIKAVDENNYSLVEEIILLGKKYPKFNINNEGNYGMSALMFVNDYNIAKLLLDNGANLGYIDIMGESVLSILFNNDKYEMINFLLEYNNIINHNNSQIINQILSDGDTILTRAIKLHKINYVYLFIKHGADVNMKDRSTMTPLMIACIHHYSDIVFLLLHYKCDVNIRNYLGQTALMISCINDDVEISKELVKNGANVDIPDNDGQSPLMSACITDNDDIVKLLILNNANVNQLDNNNRNALIYACMYDNEDMMKLLLVAGSTYSTKNYCILNEIKFIENYINSKQFQIDKYNLYIENSSLIFSNMVLLSDDYLKFKFQ